MKVIALVPLLACLAPALALKDRHHHVRQVERITNALDAREVKAQMAEMQRRVESDVARRGPKALDHKPRRIVQRQQGATGCRTRGASFTASVSTTSTSSTAAATTSITTTAVGNNNYADVTTSASETPAATTSASASASATASSTSTGSTSSGANSGSLTPNGKKAGLSAGDALQVMAPHLGWWYNWAPTDDGTSNSNVQFVPMLWGNGQADATDAARLVSFEALSSTPTWIIGPEEPDCASGSGSAGMSIAATAALWNWLMVPKGNAGSLLLSPSMCKQLAEDGWLGQFNQQISRTWDITNIHINKNNMAGVKADIDYYYNTYGKPIWVTEFACVDDSSSFIPCTDQGQINTFINDIVDLFEGDSRVYAYAYSNGYGLGETWPAWSNGALSESGQTYLNAISKY